MSLKPSLIYKIRISSPGLLVFSLQRWDYSFITSQIFEEYWKLHFGICLHYWGCCIAQFVVNMLYKWPSPLDNGNIGAPISISYSIAWADEHLKCIYVCTYLIFLDVISLIITYFFNIRLQDYMSCSIFGWSTWLWFSKTVHSNMEKTMDCMSTLHIYSSLIYFESDITHNYVCFLIYCCNTISHVASLVGVLDDDSLKLYTLIWIRTMACQMEASRTDLVGCSCISFFPMVDFVFLWWF